MFAASVWFGDRREQKERRKLTKLKIFFGKAGTFLVIKIILNSKIFLILVVLKLGREREE